MQLRQFDRYLNSAKTRFLFSWVLSGGVDEEVVDDMGVRVTLYRFATKVSHPRRKALSTALRGK